jgi:hypothetical protein
MFLFLKQPAEGSAIDVPSELHSHCLNMCNHIITALIPIFRVGMLLTLIENTGAGYKIRTRNPLITK